MAMGEAYTTLADDGTSIYWNPATLTRSPSRHSLSFMHAEYLAGIFYDFLGYGYKTRGNGAWGAGIQYLSFGSITETDASGVQTGSFHPQDLAVSVGYAYQVPEEEEEITSGYSFGLALKFIRSKIVSSASAVTLDAGLVSKPYGKGGFQWSLAAQNLGGRLKFDQVSEDLPTVLKLGAAYRLKPKWVWAADLALPRDNAPLLALGTEYRMGLKKDLDLAGRIGYNTRTVGDIDGLTGASLGIGLSLSNVGDLDYALVPFGGLGLTHRASLSMRFGAVPDSQKEDLQQ